MSFITPGLPRDGTPAISRKLRINPGRVAMDSDRKFPCKQAKLTAKARLDRTQEVAGSSPASSIRTPCNAAACLAVAAAPRLAAFGSSAASTASRTASTRCRALDVGCGSGYFTRVMAEAVAPDGTADGVDPSAEAIAQAKGLTHLANSWL